MLHYYNITILQRYNVTILQPLVITLQYYIVTTLQWQNIAVFTSNTYYFSSLQTLWECSFDPATNAIPLDVLCLELRAGGVSYEHECQARRRLAHLGSLGILDFLIYIPLFVMIHESVVDNPLDDSRLK